jgi:hypothetical protein
MRRLVKNPEKYNTTGINLSKSTKNYYKLIEYWFKGE